MAVQGAENAIAYKRGYDEGLEAGGEYAQAVNSEQAEELAKLRPVLEAAKACRPSTEKGLIPVEVLMEHRLEGSPDDFWCSCEEPGDTSWSSYPKYVDHLEAVTASQREGGNGE